MNHAARWFSHQLCSACPLCSLVRDVCIPYSLLVQCRVCINRFLFCDARQVGNGCDMENPQWSRDAHRNSRTGNFCSIHSNFPMNLPVHASNRNLYAASERLDDPSKWLRLVFAKEIYTRHTNPPQGRFPSARDSATNDDNFIAFLHFPRRAQ